MNYSAFAANLELTYAPISNHDFTSIKTDPDFQQSLASAMLYVICQRPVLTFENIHSSADGQFLHFDIRMQNSAQSLSCILPLRQEHLGGGNPINIEMNFHDDSNYNDIAPYSKVDGFKVRLASNNEFLLWLTPDKFLHHYWNGLLTAGIKGDLREFTKFYVHYVGKATDQPAIDRLTGHYTLQDILSLEKAIVKGTPSTHEIMLLLFEVGAGDYIATLAGGDDAALDMAFGNNLPDKKTVALDAEKALVKLLQPNYNHPTKRFPKYPKSKDGLYQYAFNKFSYQVKEAITLYFDNVEIRGSINGRNVDLIVVDANKTVEIVKLN